MAFGAGVGIGSAYTDCSRLFDGSPAKFTAPKNAETPAPGSTETPGPKITETPAVQVDTSFKIMIGLSFMRMQQNLGLMKPFCWRFSNEI